MHKKPTAGQATTEYIAAIALIAAIFVLAAPAVGAPSIGKAVVAKMRLALCIAGLDICDSQMAADAGLAPCPMGSKATGHALSATAYSINLGHSTTLTVTERSDGTVGVVRTAGGIAGVAGGLGGSGGVGPVSVGIGAEGSAKLRMQGALGWEFPNRAAADRFLKHAVLNTFNPDDFPVHWGSYEQGDELAGQVEVALGEVRGGSATAAALSASVGAALGGRVARGGVVTLYGRAEAEAELVFPFLPGIGPGRVGLVVEYTHDRTGPRELTFRTAVPRKLDGSRVADTAYRLNLRDPANREVAKGLIDTPWPWKRAAALKAVFDRIDSHGTVERLVTDIENESWNASAEGKVGLKFGAEFKRIKVQRKLISAGARVDGLDRQRYDCFPAK